MADQKEQSEKCFWCGEVVWGYGDTYNQAHYQARNNRLGHEATCDKRIDD